ncbi:hypothetical protein T484DRAFT_1797198 [Baffinella frigidus]|nr:hypothetical protein T484DRAFT_1797198 [Cryptophyta sp. CCMP2293]
MRCVPPYVGPSEEHVVNTEWGGFDSGKETKALLMTKLVNAHVTGHADAEARRKETKALPMTKYDCFLDSKSSNPKAVGA